MSQGLLIYGVGKKQEKIDKSTAARSIMALVSARHMSKGEKARKVFEASRGCAGT